MWYIRKKRVAEKIKVGNAEQIEKVFPFIYFESVTFFVVITYFFC